ncbi:MAG: cold shock domain-containing protein [Bacilli bacterium]|jgi:CspA family cold shock protein|nr:cold shock domain-containing protein [Bacilli bacterium]
MKGVVKMFNSTKGFGFITGEDGKDVFFHHSALVPASLEASIAVGDKVEFEAQDSPRGPRASKVEKI